MTYEERFLLLAVYKRLEKNLMRFVLQAPSFPGDTELADEIGFYMADLECKIKGL